MALVDVLIPTYRRQTGLAVVLTSLLGQTFLDFDIVIADQSGAESERPAPQSAGSEGPSGRIRERTAEHGAESEGESPLDSVEIATLLRALEWHGHRVSTHRHRPKRGMAEQRQFLLEQSGAPYVHFIDDDVLLDPPVMERMLGVLRAEGCGFVGCPATGLEYLDDVRPHQQHIELWRGPVRPEPFAPDALPWDRHKINNAANPLHLEQRLAPKGRTVRYKVCWIGGANVLYDRAKLLDVGGFSWWRRLPPNHAGEEVVVQFLLIRKYGGCGVLPSGTYHLGLPTNVVDRTHNADTLFRDLIREFDVHPVGPVEPFAADTPTYPLSPNLHGAPPRKERALNTEIERVDTSLSPIDGNRVESGPSHS